MSTRPVMFVGMLTFTDEPSVPGQPPYPSTGPGFPTHPIQLPPWAGGWQPRPDQGLPPFPSHPIVIPPGGVWPPGGGQPPYPSTGPGFPTHPIQLPPWAGGWQPRPEHPIYYPPGSGGPGGQPPYPSTGPGFPTHPIQLPPWAGGWQPRPDHGLPPFPSHPIAGYPWPQPPQPPGGGWPGGGSPPEAPGFEPIGEPGPLAGYQWYWSPTYGWLLGVPPQGETSPPEATTKPGGDKPPVPVQPVKK
jgi:hypothetical protein